MYTTLMTSQGSVTDRPPLLNVIAPKDHKFMPTENSLFLLGT